MRARAAAAAIILNLLNLTHVTASALCGAVSEAQAVEVERRHREAVHAGRNRQLHGGIRRRHKSGESVGHLHLHHQQVKAR
ncbi:exported hypothetical protein [Candidatus Defluviicoccus seviourii]|uniref:Secreted protein n=2 Tax=root TaxID=1 RepID=A0A564WAI2_9PROT|nr:exported hypothetical protein [uncultured Defluviicoccus sp.]VUX45125.1 exported hypothetical protein [Candidatus Defluviicoccus seviourii]